MGADGGQDTDYATSIAEHQAASGAWAFRGGADYARPYADFDQSYDPINGYSYESTSSRYTVQGGDTLETIAQTLWGDASYWYLIADANGLNGSETLVAGQNLIIPNKVHNAHNNASTYRVYDPNEAIGDTSPTAAKPPKHNKCGAMGQMLVAVIAIAVAVALPELVPAFQGFWGGIGAAAIGSTVSQGVGLASGIQSKFDFKGAAMSVLSAGVAGGISELAKVGGVLGNAGKFLTSGTVGSSIIRGVVASTVTQGIGVATGLQQKFDWTGVAAAGLGAGASAWGGGHFNISGKIGMGIATGMAGAIVNATTRSLIDGTDFGDNIIAALPDVIGNAIGNLVADAVAGKSREESYGIEDDRAAGPTDPNGAQDVNQDSSSGDIVVTGRKPIPFDPEFRLGPKDRYDEPSEIERLWAKITPWKDRVDRIDRMRELIDTGDYDTIIAENFTVTSESSNKSNWTESLTEDDAQYLGNGALKELLNTRTGHRILMAIASQGERQSVILNTRGENTGSFDNKRISIDVSRSSRNVLGDHDIDTPLAVVMAHEFGHSVFNYHDILVDPNAIVWARNHAEKKGNPISALTNFQTSELRSMGQNVEFVENSIRQELGLKLRSSYVSDSQLRRRFPELFK